MTRAPFFRPLALAAALAALGAGPAHAMSDWQRECQRGTYEINPYTPCAQPFHEGLAAVMTGSEEDEAYCWGYIDKQGRMAIAPAFQEATPFQNGLAAVRQDDLWGYIDAKGAWAIRPAYAEATGFNAQGTALVRIDERDVLIDRQGQTVKTLPLGARSWGFRPGQTLAEIEVPQPPRLFNVATGRALTLPDDVMALGEPTQGQIPAQRRASRYNGWWGLLSANGRWAVPPETLRSEEAPLRDGNVIAVRRDGRWQFVDPQGRPLSKQRYGDRVALLAPGAWLVKREHNAPAILLDADLLLMRSFRQDYAWPEKREGWTVLRDDEAILLVDPVGSASCPCRKAAWTSRTVAPGSMPGPRTAPPMRRPTGRRTRRLTPPTPPSTPRRPPPTPRSPSRRPRARRASATTGMPSRARLPTRRRPAPREPDPAPPTPLRSIGCPILPPSRIRRRPWSSCPSPPRTCPRQGRPPCRSRRKPPMPRPWRWTRRRKQARPWMPPSRKQLSRKRR
ncbi:WG repeat-containing protein [Achromobacter xylosoxidans]